MRKKELPKGYRWKNTAIEHRFTVDGKRYQVYGSTVKECDAAEFDLRKSLSDGIKVDANKITFSQYFEEWLRNLDPKTKRSTVHSYRKKFQTIKKHIGNMRVIDIDRRDIKAMKNIFAEKLAPSTTNYYLSLTSNILRSAVNDRIIAYNPAADIHVKDDDAPARETIHRALSIQEQKIFFQYAKNSWYYEVFSLMVNTGMRVGEIGALKWKDYDASAIHVTSTVTETGYKEYDIGSPKTRASRRNIALNDQIRSILLSQKKKVIEFMGVSYCHKDCNVFYKLQSSGYLTSDTINHAIESVRMSIPESERMEHFTSHAFRDTFATRCIEQGMEPNVLKEILGHTKLATTMDLYVHNTEDVKTAAMKAIAIDY